MFKRDVVIIIRIYACLISYILIQNMAFKHSSFLYPFAILIEENIIQLQHCKYIYIYIYIQFLFSNNFVNLADIYLTIINVITVVIIIIIIIMIT